MNTQVRELVEKAKLLKPEEQEELLDAVHGLLLPTDPEWEAAWAKECEARAAAIDAGAPTYDFDEVMADARERLKQRQRS